MLRTIRSQRLQEEPAYGFVAHPLPRIVSSRDAEFALSRRVILSCHNPGFWLNTIGSGDQTEPNLVAHRLDSQFQLELPLGRLFSTGNSEEATT